MKIRIYQHSPVSVVMICFVLLSTSEQSCSAQSIPNAPLELPNSVRPSDLDQKKVLKFSGKAVFSDGRPVANARLIVSPLGKSQTRYWSTDEDGNFDIDLRGPETIGAHFIAECKSEHSVSRKPTKRSWSCSLKDPVAWLKDAEEQNQLVFDNRGQIIVRVFGLKQLPDGYQAELSLSPKPTARRDLPPELNEGFFRERAKLDPRQVGTVIKGLEPREYVVSVQIPKLGRKEFTTTVVIPNADPFQCLAKLQIDPLQFSSFVARVVLPDGSLAAHASFAMSADGGNADSVRINADSDGRLKVQHVPVGELALMATEANFAGVTTYTNIAPNEVSDLGVIRLKSDEEVYSWLSGKLNVETDRNENLSCQGFHAPGYDITRTPDLRLTAQFQDGKYRIKYPSGKHLLRLEVDQEIRMGLWQSMTSKYFLLSVDGKPGDRAVRDLVVPAANRIHDSKGVSWIVVKLEEGFYCVVQTKGVADKCLAPAGRTWLISNPWNLALSEVQEVDVDSRKKDHQLVIQLPENLDFEALKMESFFNVQVHLDDFVRMPILGCKIKELHRCPVEIEGQQLKVSLPEGVYTIEINDTQGSWSANDVELYEQTTVMLEKVKRKI